MIALVRYELAVLARSQRWVAPLLAYGAAVAGLGAASGAVSGAASGALGGALGGGLGGGPQTVGQALRWSALLLVPVAAWLTRVALTAEPDAARACVAAAAGPRRAQLAALTAALVAAALVGVGGVAWALVAGGYGAGWPGEVGAGLLVMMTCLLVGSAVGAACNPPLVRRPGAAALATVVFAVVALAWSASPANAAVTSAGPGVPEVPGHGWPSGLALAAAIVLAALVWAVSAAAAARRSG